MHVRTAYVILQGKTYSMIGPRLGTTAFDKQQLLTESDGFLARAYANVFQSIEARQSEVHVAVRASCCEVYHEQVTCKSCWECWEGGHTVCKKTHQQRHTERKERQRNKGSVLLPSYVVVACVQPSCCPAGTASER